MTPATRFPQQLALLAATFVIAICGLVYELLAGTLSSYLLGDSVYQFSLVIGLFMSSMGIGSWLSRFVDGALPLHFVRLQLLVGLTGGFTAPILFFAFAILDNYSPLLFLLVILLGAMMGMEIPLVVRILREHFSLKTNLSNVFTADYIGALFAALLFPLVLVPQLGLLQTGFLFGILNLLVGLLALLVFRNTVATAPRKRLQWSILAGLLMLALGFVLSERFTASMETRLYQDEIIHAEDSPYQRLVLTRRQGRLRFYLNGALQFDSIDEYRYHETLVHPALGLLPQVEEVLILGGGDGMAARELLKDPRIKAITLVDLDPAVTTLFSTSPLLTRLNRHSLTDPKLTRVNTDAWKFLEQSRTLYDLVVIDLPDPNNASLSRLYSRSFYHLVKQHVSRTGIILTQATSPLFSRAAFWCINQTLGLSSNHEAWHTLPYHSYIPSFGEWGFIMAARYPLNPDRIRLPLADYRYLDQAMLDPLFRFPPDMATVDTQVNELSSHALLRYYEQGWSEWYE